jgi:hypothetical protein
MGGQPIWLPPDGLHNLTIPQWLEEPVIPITFLQPPYWPDGFFLKTIDLPLKKPLPESYLVERDFRKNHAILSNM